ncbi:MAG: hypothetical protein ACR2IV_22505 [Bryobacteraceae bacterium]
MKQLMDKNVPQRGRPPHKLRIDYHLAFPNKAGRVDRSASVRLLAQQFPPMGAQL